MSWFGNSGTKYINETRVLYEGESVEWVLDFDRSTPVSLFVQQIDGYGPNVVVVPADEISNFKNGLVYKYIADLSLNFVQRFSTTATLGRGRYYLVVFLPTVYDDGQSYSEFQIRYELIT